MVLATGNKLTGHNPCSAPIYVGCGWWTLKKGRAGTAVPLILGGHTKSEPFEKTSSSRIYKTIKSKDILREQEGQLIQVGPDIVLSEIVPSYYLSIV